jgi:hypothetical protein
MKHSKILKVYTILLIILTVLFTQHSSAQENKTANNSHEVKKYTYQFMGEFSLLQLGINFNLKDSYSDELDIGPNAVKIGLNLINNMVYKEKISIGLGIGMEYALLQGEMGLPLFVDFRYYFKKNVKHILNSHPFVNIGVGAITILNLPNTGFFSANDLFIYKPGFYLNCSSGFKVKRFLLNAGINLKAYQWKYYDSWGNVVVLDFVIKLGFNI